LLGSVFSTFGFHKQAELPKVQGQWFIKNSTGKFVFRLGENAAIAKLVFPHAIQSDCLVSRFSLSALAVKEKGFEKIGEFSLVAGKRFQEFAAQKEVKDTLGFRIDVIGNHGNKSATCLPDFRVFSAISV
jgi:hypothetical protein